MALVQGDDDAYEDRHPEPGEIALTVEVSDKTSLKRDRGEKRDLYGRAGIPVYWLVNLVNRQVEVYANPTGGAYPAPKILGETEFVDLIVGGQAVGQIAVADLLPTRR